MAAAGTAPPTPKTFVAVGAITKYRFVKHNLAGANQVEECDTQGEAAIGVCVETVADGEAVSVWLLGDGGIVPIEMSAARTLADPEITTGIDGRGEAAALADVIHGRIVEAASGAGHVVGFVPEYSGRTHA